MKAGEKACEPLTDLEALRIADLLRILPRGRSSVLDVGARRGVLTKRLVDHFESVLALDLVRPAFEHPGITTVAGDATRLQFADASFDTVVCTEVLEHIPDVRTAARELARVARYDLVIGVPYRQDIRLGRLLCRNCGKVSPPWGHLHSFDEESLGELFPGCTQSARSFIGTTDGRTSALAVWLMDLGGNPWGPYGQEERCIHCDAKFEPAGERPLWKRCCSSVAARINRVHSRLVKPRPKWIHMVLSKTAG